MSVDSTSQLEDQNHPNQDGRSISPVRGDADTELQATNGVNGIHDNSPEFKTYYPVFCRSEVNDVYFDEFSKFAFDDDTPWQEITSTDPARIFAELHGTLENRHEELSPPSPFINSTIADIYAFFKTHLCPVDNTHHTTFTSATFIVVDAACLGASPLECILCCDAPDYGEPIEGEAVLKQLRLPLEMAVLCLVPLEMMSVTPSEIAAEEPMVLSSMPPVVVMPFDDDTPATHEYRPARPTEARINKRRVIERFPAGRDDERRAIFFRCSVREAKIAAMMHRVMLAKARRLGWRIKFRDTRAARPIEETTGLVIDS